MAALVSYGILLKCMAAARAQEASPANCVVMLTATDCPAAVAKPVAKFQKERLGTPYHCMYA